MQCKVHRRSQWRALLEKGREPIGTRTLQAVRFVDNKVTGLSLGIDEELRASNGLAMVIKGYSLGLVEPTVMFAFKPTGPIRVFLGVITPSPGGISPDQWKQTATVRPPDWPTDYSLLRLWHHKKSLHQYAALLHDSLGRRHMFSHWTVNVDALAGRVLYKSPANYSPRFAWGGRPHRRFISVRERG